MISRASVFALGLGLSACAVSDETTQAVQEVRGCTNIALCGANSPAVSIYKTNGFRLDYQPNHEGFVLLNISVGDYFFALDIVNDRIVARDGTGKIAYQGQQLEKAKIWVDRAGEQFAIEIQGVGTTWEQTDYPQPQELEHYVLAWAPALKQTNLLTPVPAGTQHEVPALTASPQYVCPEPDWSPLWLPNEWDETQHSLAPYQSIVFQGDEIFTDTRTIAPHVDDHWFNIGCGLHTLAKMRLTRNTIKTAQSPSWERAQTVMKMLSADYCNRGAMTVPGHPLLWRDGFALQEYFDGRTPSNLEARWNQNGAMCLENPRLYTLIDVYRACRGAMPPSCGDRNPLNWEKELVTSGNY